MLSMDKEYQIQHYAIQVRENEFVYNYDLTLSEENRVIETTNDIKNAFQLINYKVGLLVAAELNSKLIKVDRCNIN
jgi:hypothetical protein